MWARAPSLSEPTSTNAAESYNGRYNDGHTSAHPNIHRTVQALLDQQEDVYILERTIRAKQPSKLASEALKVKTETMRAWEDLQEGKLSVYQYLFHVGTLNKSIKLQRQNRA